MLLVHGSAIEIDAQAEMELTRIARDHFIGGRVVDFGRALERAYRLGVARERRRDEKGLPRTAEDR